MSDPEYGNRRDRSRSPDRRGERRNYYNEDKREPSYRRPMRQDYNDRFGDGYGSGERRSRPMNRPTRYNDRYNDDRNNDGYSNDRRRGRRNDRYDNDGRGSGRGGRRGGGGFRVDRRFRDDDRRPRGFRGNRNMGDYGPILDKDLDSSYEEKVNRNYINSVFVGNLTYDCTPEDLRGLFENVGEVVRADIITSRGHHRGMGTVEFTNTEGVDEAIKDYDGTFFMERQIFVRQDNPPPEDTRRERDTKDRRSNRDTRENRITNNNSKSYEILISNLPYSINWQALKDMFKECGDVLRADVDLDNHGYSKGTGIVLLANKESMERSISKYNGYEFEGNILEVREGNNETVDDDKNNNPDVTMEAGSEYKTNNDDDKENNNQKISVSSDFTDGIVGGGERSTLVYCSNLPFSTAKSDLYDLFETIGSLKNADLKHDGSGAPTGVAVIEYENIDDADVCIDRLNNYNYGGCDLDISYGKKQ